MKGLLLLFAAVVVIAAAFNPEKTGRWIGTFGGSVVAAFDEAAHGEKPKP